MICYDMFATKIICYFKVFDPFLLANNTINPFYKMYKIDFSNYFKFEHQIEFIVI